jgi:hypothetical protein
MADVRAGLALAGAALASDVIDGKTYWFSSALRAIAPAARTAFFLPLYDEYGIGYKDRSAALDAGLWLRAVKRHPFVMPFVLGGRVVGAWRQKTGPKGVEIGLGTFQALTRRDASVVEDAAAAYGRFLGTTVTVTTGPLRR